MTIRLYIDEDSMDKDLVQALRARGVDVITALDAGMVERGDAEHLAGCGKIRLKRENCRHGEDLRAG